MSVPASTLEAVLRRDRWLILGGVLGAAAIAWTWLVAAGRDMYGDMTGAAAWMMVTDWDARYFVLIFAMWTLMMVGMMLPSAAPMLLLYGMNVRNSPNAASPIARVYAFAAGYLLVWTGFSFAATVLQWALSRLALLTPMMESGSPRLAGALLIAAGVYQWTPLKRGCLAQCRGPLAFMTGHWRPGIGGALRMGLAHGLFCLGCCWVLMLLLFVGGVMNLTWIAAITVFVLLEKLAPLGAQGGKLSGFLLAVAGTWTLLHG